MSEYDRHGAAGAVLVCNEDFQGFGENYEKGDIIPPEHVAKWPKGTLARRIKNGFVSWEASDESEEAEDEAKAEPSAAATALPEDLAHTKEALVKWVRRNAPWVQKLSGYELRSDGETLRKFVVQALAKGPPPAPVKEEE